MLLQFSFCQFSFSSTDLFLTKNIQLIPQCGEEYCSPSKPNQRNLKIAEVVGGWSHWCWHGTSRFPGWKTWLKCTLLSQGPRGEIRWNYDKERQNKWVPCLPEGRLRLFYECENLFLALHRHLWKMCHCCISLCVSCQKEWAWGNVVHLTHSAGRLVDAATSFWRALLTQWITEEPARSETALDVVLENHPGALNKTEASKHLGGSDLNVFRSEVSPTEGSSSKAWNIGSFGNFTLNRSPYLWGDKRVMKISIFSSRSLELSGTEGVFLGNSPQHNNRDTVLWRRLKK